MWLLSAVTVVLVPAGMARAQVDDALVRDLQSDLGRLDYYRGAVDGLDSDALGRALLSFERDEQLAPEAEPTPRLLELTHDAVARIPGPGSCPADSAPAGLSIACGSIR